MLKDITLGQYLPTGSFIHKLDPRIKILHITLFMISIFFVKSFYMYIPLIAYLVFCIIGSKIKLKYIFKGLKSLIFIIGLTAFLNMIMTPGEVIFKIWIFKFTKQGMELAAFMMIRFILLVSQTSLLTLTTSPIRLTDGLESIMSPLRIVNFPVGELSMMMSITLRFIPTLIEETDKIMKAQKARGANFESGKLKDKIKNIVPIIVPLFLNSLRRADELAIAMEARCYQIGTKRTKLNPLKFKRNDYIALVFGIIFFGIIISMRYI